MKSTLEGKDRTIKILQDKRDNIMKEMEKMGRNSKMNHPEPVSITPTPRIQHPPSEALQLNEGREKKIAGKALKGF